MDCPISIIVLGSLKGKRKLQSGFYQANQSANHFYEIIYYSSIENVIKLLYIRLYNSNKL